MLLPLLHFYSAIKICNFIIYKCIFVSGNNQQELVAYVIGLVSAM